MAHLDVHTTRPAEGDHRWSAVAGTLILGLIALGLVILLLWGAASSSQANRSAEAANRNVADLFDQLDKANAQLAQLRRDEAAAEDRSTQAAAERRAVLRQNRQLQRQVSAMAAILRAHGFSVPGASQTTAGAGGGSGGGGNSSPPAGLPSQPPSPRPPHSPSPSPRPPEPTPGCVVLITQICLPPLP